jgi:hypothetical protein
MFALTSRTVVGNWLQARLNQTSQTFNTYIKLLDRVAEVTHFA